MFLLIFSIQIQFLRVFPPSLFLICTFPLKLKIFILFSVFTYFFLQHASDNFKITLLVLLGGLKQSLRFVFNSSVLRSVGMLNETKTKEKTK